MKYAVVESGGKQYVTREGETIEIDRVPKRIGQAIEFKEVLLVVDDGKVRVGTPFVRGARVRGKVVDHIKAPKVIVFKYKPRVGYRRKRGHRQRYSQIVINSIALSSPRKKAAVAEPTTKPKKVTTTRKTKPKATKSTSVDKSKTSREPAKSSSRATKPAKKKVETKKTTSSAKTKTKKSTEK
jgi:large subunit ribosomal protein L21